MAFRRTDLTKTYFGAALGAVVVVASATGCGGNSSSFTPGTGGSAGKGGSSGDAGEPGSGGSSGSGAMGGKAGSGGSSTTGGTGGTSTTGGAAGNPGSGGSAAGTGGTGGTGAMTGYHPPEAQVEACTAMCEREAEAMCPNDDPLEKCIGDCRIAILFEDCSAEWDAVFACAESANVSCDSSGEATFAGCLTPYAAAIGCVFGDGLNTDFEARCSDFCAASTAPDCENGESAGECTEGCVVLASAFPVCNDVLTNYLDCGASAEFSCGEDGEPEAAECLSESVLFLSCVVTEYDVEP